MKLTCFDFIHIYTMSSLALTSDIDIFSDVNSSTEASLQPSFLQLSQHDDYYQ